MLLPSLNAVLSLMFFMHSLHPSTQQIVVSGTVGTGDKEKVTALEGLCELNCVPTLPNRT